MRSTLRLVPLQRDAPSRRISWPKVALVLVLCIGWLLLWGTVGSRAALAFAIILAVVASTYGFVQRRRSSGRVVQLHESAVVNASCELVWNVIKPAERAAALDPAIRRGYRVPGTPLGLGEQQAFERVDGSTVIVEVIEYEEGRRATLRPVSPTAVEDWRITESVEPVGGGCRYAVTFEIDLPAGRWVLPSFEDGWRTETRHRISRIRELLADDDPAVDHPSSALRDPPAELPPAADAGHVERTLEARVPGEEAASVPRSSALRRRTYEQRRRRTRGVWATVACLIIAVTVALAIVIGSEMRHNDDILDGLLAMHDHADRPYTASFRPSRQPPGEARLLPERSVVDPVAPFEVANTNWQGDPMRFDPCRPITVVVSAHLATHGYVEVVTDVLAEVSAASGLAFEVEDHDVDETYDIDRSAYDPQQYGDRWSPVLIAWSTPQAQPLLEGDIIGWARRTHDAGPAGRADQRRWYVSGDIALDAAQLGDDLSMHRIVLLHELGHLLGLDHVDDPHQIMYPEIRESVAVLGAGDLNGLAVVGAGACAPSL